jgi:4-alpha-glucanotransferase
MQIQRAGGILLHPTSFPGPHGIGDLGPQAHRFIDWLAAAECKLWQILPLGPTGYGNSPYQCHSVFAGNPYLISPDLLVRDGLLSESDLAQNPYEAWALGPSAARVDFGRLIPWKLALLQRAFEHFQANDPGELREQFALFRAQNASWLEDFAVFMALKESSGGGSWHTWAAPLRTRDEQALAIERQQLGQSIERMAFFQFLFFRQWSELRDHAHAQGIKIIGDIPIFAADDSADVWSHRQLFCLDEQGRPTAVSGVPPDYFSPTGQLWGNPHYRWEAHKSDGYAWWIQRLRATCSLVDMVRIDHFRGFSGYWEIPAGNPTAEIGRWVPGPSDGFFDAVQRHLAGLSPDGDLPFIAEDLGVITSDVLRMRDKYGIPGMKILQFGFSGPDNQFLPHNYVPHCVAYTGTHDNDTSRGWYAHAPKAEAVFARRYLHTTSRNFSWDLIRTIWSSVAVFAITPMQDLLNLGTEARMNYPSRSEGNWEWRMQTEDMSAALAGKIQRLNKLYGR